jgi:hypothetical protein
MKLSPAKEANRLTHILDTFHQVHGAPRFPVDVKSVALECGGLLGFGDPITKVVSADIKGFEGGLFKTAENEWTLLYNSALHSAGRIRFTQAHELGHYLLHRSARQQFECTSDDMLEWPEDERNIEAEADKFASYFLMPINDFRSQVTATVDLEVLGACSDRYGVSVTAAILKWLSFTEEKAVLILSRDGFMDWAWSSSAAFESGAFFAARKRTLAIPAGSLAADERFRRDLSGTFLPIRAWFQHADIGLSVREMKLSAEQYGYTLTLLMLPRIANCWPSKFG